MKRSHGLEYLDSLLWATVKTIKSVEMKTFKNTVLEQQVDKI